MTVFRGAPAISTLILLWLLPACSAADNTTATAAAESITVDELRGHVYFLADDALAGRDTGSEGYAIAAEYAASQFRGSGCRPIFTSEDGEPTYFQYFRMQRSRSGGEISYRLLTDEDLSNGNNSVETRNVVAWIEGTDPILRGEYVVISAHLDHVGTRGGRIFNGADDNASGCAAVLEIAEAFAMAPPRRSVIFALFAAEEIGLRGSSFFVGHPPVPLENVVADINLDMIGRPKRENGGGYRLYVVGSDGVCDGMSALVAAVNARTAGFELDFEGAARYSGDSDHFSFNEAGVPAAFLFDFMEEDFHEPSDDADKIDYEVMKRVAGLAYELVLECANADATPCPRQAADR